MIMWNIKHVAALYNLFMVTIIVSCRSIHLAVILRGLLKYCNIYAHNYENPSLQQNQFSFGNYKLSQKLKKML